MKKADIDSLMFYWICFMLVLCCVSILTDIVSYVLNFVFDVLFAAFFIGVPILFLFSNPIYFVVPAILSLYIYAHFIEEDKKLEKT